MAANRDSIGQQRNMVNNASVTNFGFENYIFVEELCYYVAGPGPG